MNADQQQRSIQRISTQLIEEVGADAVVIVFSKVRGDQTTTHLHTWGNALACRGLVDEAFQHLCEVEDDETEAEEFGDA